MSRIMERIIRKEEEETIPKIQCRTRQSTDRIPQDREKEERHTSDSKIQMWQ